MGTSCCPIGVRRQWIWENDLTARSDTVGQFWTSERDWFSCHFLSAYFELNLKQMQGFDSCLLVKENPIFTIGTAKTIVFRFTYQSLNALRSFNFIIVCRAMELVPIFLEAFNLRFNLNISFQTQIFNKRKLRL